MSVITKDLGVATAYGYAKSKGYTGTEEEFAELMASYADVAQQAEAAAQDAEDAKDAAITAKTAAQTAQTAAESAHTAAAGSAQTASTKATEASNSAQTAAGSATAAGDSATAAADSATTAQTAAQTATTKASEASSSASAASTAKTGAETARTGAQTAQTAAETAQANAEAAASSVSASAAQIEQNTEDITGLKNDLSELNGDAVKRDMSYHPFVNYLNPDDITAGYLDTSGGHHGNAYRSYTGFIPVSEGDVIRTYRRANVNTLRLTNDQIAKFYTLTAYNSSKVAVAASGTSTASNTYTVPSGIAYVRVSVYNEMTGNKGMITINDEVTSFVPYGDSYTALPEFLDGAFTGKTAQPVLSKGFKTVSGSLSDGSSLEIEGTTVKYGQRYAFSGKITSFSSIIIGQAQDAGSGSWVVIDSTKITVYAKYSGSESSKALEANHGLTISDFIYIDIIQEKDKHSVKVFLQTNGGSYTTETAGWYGYAGANAFVKSSGSVLSDCVFSFASSEFRKTLWLFGDSYISDESQSRWAYYLKQNGMLDSVMLAGYPGAAPREMYPMFENALTYYGRPYMCIWDLGMNGDADTDVIGPLYHEYLRGFLDKCKIYNVIPILCTVPTVPSLNHEVRNAYVRSSGYRYIDFADAVGAQADGTWYTGMLSSDNVHPTELGAYALYLRAIRDCPELTYNCINTLQG